MAKMVKIFLHPRDRHEVTSQSVQRYAFFKKNWHSATIFIACGIMVAGLFQAAHIINFGARFAGKVLGIATSGVGHLELAKNLLQAKQTEEAQVEFVRAISDFKQASTKLQSVGSVISRLLDILPQKRDGEALLSAADHISRAGAASTDIYRLVGSLSFSLQGLESARPAKEILGEIENLLAQVELHTEQASNLLSQVRNTSLPKPQATKLEEARQILAISNGSVKSLKDFVHITKILATGQRQVLLVLQNNNELRPTGGFIGTYGTMKLTEGKIEKMHVSSIYDIDGQLTERITPPVPILRVNGLWTLRDSNWFAHVPDSAKVISTFYEKEGGETPDLVIFATPDVVTNILRITGPIVLPRYKVTLTADNFVETIQSLTSYGYDHEQNQPKQLLADLFPAILQKIYGLESSSRVLILESLQDSLATKALMLYSRIPEVQKTFSVYHWAGEIQFSDRDYLSVISANLNGSKTDRYISEQLSIHADIQTDGTVVDTLVLSRKLGDAATQPNESFIRILVPAGSTLLNVSGFDAEKKKIDPLPDTTIDPQVEKLQQGMSIEVENDLYKGQEAGKNFYGSWLSVVPGESKTITLSYQLPFKLSNIDRYQLLYQVQPGSQPKSLDFLLSGAPQILWSTSGFVVNEQKNSAHALGIIDRDTVFGAVVDSSKK